MKNGKYCILIADDEKEIRDILRLLLEQVPSRYMLVNVVAQRARQIASAAEDAGIPLDEKPVTLAIHQVAEGQVELQQDE